MKNGQKVKLLVVNAQNGDQDALIQLVYRFIPIVKKYSRGMGYEEAYADLIAWIVNAVHKYDPPDDSKSEIWYKNLFQNGNNRR